MKDGARVRGGGVIADKAARAQIGENTVRNLNNIAKKLRVTIEFVKTLGDSNGLYQNGKIYIALDADNPYIVVASHEITHHMQALSKKAYEKFRNMAVRYEAKAAKISSADLVDAKRNAYAEHGRVISRSEALDEIAADFTQKVFSNNEQLESFLKRIAAENPENRSVLKKFSDSVRAILKAIGEHIPHKDKITLEETVRRFDETFKAAERNAKTKFDTGKAKNSIKLSGKGYYVKADRQVIEGNDPKNWGNQVRDYINSKIRSGKNVTVYSIDGDALTITADTAGKAAFRNYVIGSDGKRRLMTDKEYAVKLRAESHIDELSRVSTRGK